jgi:adenylate cyclase
VASDVDERKLAALLSADVVGYTRTLTDFREAIAMLVRQHRGRVVDSPGDNLLAEFPTALDAVRAAVEMQGVLRARNANLPRERRMEFRIGVHLGDGRVEEGRIYGDGVNIAARLEGLAQPGGICISATVHEQVRNKIEVDYTDLGDQTVKNVPDQVHVYQLSVPTAQSEEPRAGRRGNALRTAGVAAGAVVLALGLAVWATWPLALGLVVDAAGLGKLPANPPLPDIPSIAVLPFVNLSDDPAQEYFSDGITEDLTTDLSRNPYLFVISRNSAFTYKGKPVKVEEVGRELGVRYVLEGSVRKAGDRLRITAQLIDANSGFHVWSERYDRKLADIFALQSEISEEILAALQVEIPAAELKRIQSKPTDNLTAYDLYQQGLARFNRYTRQDNAEARRLLERAVELDPGYAEAVGLLGATYTVESGFLWNPDPTLMDRAEELAERAIALNPSVPGPHTSLAAIYLFRGRPDAAVAAAERAIERAPNFEAPYFFLGMAKAQQGKFVAATQALNRGLRVNPRAPSGVSAIVPYVNLAAGRTDEAVEMFEQIRAGSPELIGVRIPLVALYESRGRHEEARAVAGEILAVNPHLTAESATGFIEGLVDAETAAEWEGALRTAGLP